RVVPRYAGVWVIALGSGGEERKEVVPRALNPVVELFVAGSDDSHFSFALFERRLHAIQCIGVVFEKKRRSARLEDNGGVDGKVRSGRQPDAIGRQVGVQFGGYGLEKQVGHAGYAVEPPVGQRRVLFFANGDRKSTRLNSSHVKISYAV